MSACPSRDELRRLLDAPAEAPEALAFAAHVEGCPVCQRALDGLSSGESQVPVLSIDEGSSWEAFAAAPVDSEFLRGLEATPPSRLLAESSASGEGDRSAAEFPAIPGYDVLEVLGRGGMGVVYKARHRQLNRIVALKTISQHRHAIAELRERFLVEAEAVARLHHVNIIQIYEFGESSGSPFVTLELLEGGSLADRLKGTTHTGHEAAAMVATLATAMHAAHQAGIVHRDLKPANVLFDWEGTPKITDFGLAKRLEIEDGQTESGVVMGTPSYMAPEQALGLTQEIGPATDVYALGAVLYEMLTGRPPFKGSSVMDTLRQIVHDDVLAPSRIQPRLTRDLETICLKCLEKEARRRYATAAELADDLQRYLERRPIHARRTPIWERTAKWTRRYPAAAALIGLATAACLTAFVVYHDYDNRQKAAIRIGARKLAEQRGRSERDLESAAGLLMDRNWNQSQLLLSNLLESLKDAPKLDDVRSRARRLLGQAEKGIQEAADRAGAAERYRRFVQHRDDAYFHETRFTGLDLPANVQATRDAARAALSDVAEAHPGDRWTFSGLPRALAPQERAEVADGCYELLLVLADAVLQPVPGEEAVRQAERALAILDQAAELHPQSTPTYHRQRAACLALTSDTARASYERSLAADRLLPTTLLDHFLAGRDAYKRKDWKSATLEFETVVRMRPGHFWALALGGATALQTNQPELAKLSLSACIEREPTFAWLYLLRGFASGQAAVQARAAGKTLGIRDGSIDVRVEAQFDRAEDDFSRALEILDRKPNDELRWAVLVDRGLMRFQRQRLDAAVADLQQAIAINPQQYFAYASLAQVFQRQAKWDLALEQFTLAIALRPDWSPLYRGRAAVQQERDDQSAAHRRAALRDLDDAIRCEKRASPLLAFDQTRRAELLRRQGRLSEALAACDESLKLTPDADAAHRVRVLLLLDLGRSDEVLRSCDGALAKGKPWPDIREIRGMARASLGDYLGAIDDYSAALLQRPNQARVLASRGLAYLVTDSLRPALRDFDEALRIDPLNGEAHSGRGLVLALQGDYQNAIAEAEASLRAEPVPARRAYNAARVYAQAAVAAAGDVGEKGRLAITLVDRYQDQAVRLVKRALELTAPERRAAFWQGHVSADPALRSLRRRLRPLQPSDASNGTKTSGVEPTANALR